MTREDKAKEEMEWRKINEDIELEREGVEPLLDSYFVYSTEVTNSWGKYPTTYSSWVYRSIYIQVALLIVRTCNTLKR